jgi:hypothetical protein
LFLLPTINPTTHAPEISTLTSRGTVLRTETNERRTDAPPILLRSYRFALRVYHTVKVVFLPLPQDALTHSLSPSASLAAPIHPRANRNPAPIGSPRRSD